MSGDAVRLVARELRKAFRGRVVVDGVSLEVAPGEIVGLLGPNGAGKTTCFNMLMGLLRADAGRVLLGERDITGWPMHRRARAGIGYLSQDPSVFRRLSVRDNLRLYLEAAGVEGEEAVRRVREALREFDLERIEDSLARALSGGERRRLEIARATIQRPSFLLLDEPFSGIDPLAVEEIRRQVLSLSARGVGVLLTDHNVRETLSTCQRAYIVKDGRIIEAGRPEAIARSERARSAYLGESFRLE
ncbi:MAG: LPS export ABC transporter ATP-binding protein [Myxococcales bacterium]|nr:LPS export ABC transporter ATP-binding protein [Myxococcales bacterium]